MVLDITRLFRIYNPSTTLNWSNLEDRKYYIDFSSVRGNNIINEIKRTILYGGQQTCQLFTGHIGCGKSTELSRLKAELEEENFHVVYFQSTLELDMGDLDITDILLVIARQIALSLEEAKISLKPTRFQALLEDTVKLLNSEVTGLNLKIPVLGDIGIEAKPEQYSLALAIGKITTSAKDSYKLRNLSRQYLEPQVKNILKAINEEVIETAKQKLEEREKKGLVIIVDALEKIDNKAKLPERNQPEYLFIDRGDQLKQFNCHVVYTIPPTLVFSNEQESLRNRFGIDPKMLPMVRVTERNGSSCLEGIELLRKMVLERAFPSLDYPKSYEQIGELFDTVETLDFLCQVSGGHIRNLLLTIFNCLQQDNPPFSRNLVNHVLSLRRSEMSIALKPDEWNLLRQVAQNKSVSGEDKYQSLIKTLYILEYRNEDECWFDINPVLAGAKELDNG